MDGQKQIPVDGALPFAPSLDTVGFFTESVDDMLCLWTRGFGGRCDAPLQRAARFRVHALRSAEVDLDDVFHDYYRSESADAASGGAETNDAL